MNRRMDRDIKHMKEDLNYLELKYLMNLYITFQYNDQPVDLYINIQGVEILLYPQSQSAYKEQNQYFYFLFACIVEKDKLLQKIIEDSFQLY